MVIIARSDARAIEGLQAAIDRVNAYLEAGADVGFLEAPQSREELAAAAKRVLAVLKRDGDTAAIESELATFSDREEAVNSKRWRELETKYLKEV